MVLNLKHFTQILIRSYKRFQLLRIPHRLIVRYRRYWLKRKPTTKEQTMMAICDNLYIKYEFQKIIYPYIVDFYIPSVHVIFEIDGGVHKDRAEYDDKRSYQLTRKGYALYRLLNDDVTIWTVRQILENEAKTPTAQIPK